MVGAGDIGEVRVVHDEGVEDAVVGVVVLGDEDFSFFGGEDAGAGELRHNHKVHSHIQHSLNVHLLPDQSVKS